jgi:endo-1,4-beta-D-glucanase Y
MEEGEMARQRHGWSQPALWMALLACVLASSGPGRAEVEDPFRFPYKGPTSIRYELGPIEEAWRQWKSRHVIAENAGAPPRLRVLKPDDGTTVSEGIGYGMMLAVVFDEPDTLDGLWLFALDKLDEQGLMHWQIDASGAVLRSGAATDADLDMAIALVFACVKTRQGVWPPSANGLDHCAAATDLIERIYRYEVDRPGSDPPGGLNDNLGDELMPGDEWNMPMEFPDGITNPSYFSPGYMRVFGKFTGKTEQWDRVIRRQYEIIDLAQKQPGNCSGLVPNWTTYSGKAQWVAWQWAENEYAAWSFDAARLSWRVALDHVWYGSAEAAETMGELGSFFASVGMDNIRFGYFPDGTPWREKLLNPFHVAHAAVAIWAAPRLEPVTCGEARGRVQSTPQQAYDQVVAVQEPPGPYTYYNNAWRLLAMLLMSGNFPNFYEMSQ